MRAIPPVGTSASHALSYAVPWPKEEAGRREFLESVTKIKPDPFYHHAYRRWKLLQEGRCLLTVEATLGGPLAVGLGNASPLEVGLTLHKTYGVPLIPGSAIKGTCLRAVSALPEPVQKAAASLFGSQDSAGYAIFHDAWLVPQQAPLQLDTITVHHSDYYQTQSAWPTDFDDPVPIAFLSVPPGEKFLFAIELPGASPEWKTFVESMLHHALTEVGIGGKTNPGYGWFEHWLAAPTIVWESAIVTRIAPRERHLPTFIRVSEGDKYLDIDDRSWGLLPDSLRVGQNQKIPVRVTLVRSGERLIATAVERR